ncbi:hypothetical protein BOTBODRAFT_170117 [Botryobasidium botryosum FD-172 SS1]|uniref:F-box domain-containing protein n=1 Tax=Botryobasidium botryosum (strain FD-172 SS1) TaxID=930990 RepID=A0A067MZG5_BOTB1|nr:hypothetical protein BOTBODRAFT_170117 [Botryobasidium botryosum FD-172 SS1]
MLLAHNNLERALALYDVAESTLGRLGSNALLSLALTSKAHSRVVLPYYMHRHVVLPSCVTPAATIAFLESSKHGYFDHTRSLVLALRLPRPPALDRSGISLDGFADVIECMTNIQSLSFHDTHRLCQYNSRMLVSVAKLGRLRSLELARYTHDDLEPLLHVSGLRHLSLAHPSYDRFYPAKLHNSNVVQIVRNSRTTLQSIKLVEVDLDFDFIPSYSLALVSCAAEWDGMLPGALRLELESCSGHRWLPNLSVSLPSVRLFDSPRAIEWAHYAVNGESLARLLSLGGPMALFPIALQAGASLQRARVHDDVHFETGLDLARYFPCDLKSLHLKIWGFTKDGLARQNIFQKLVSTTPNLIFLHINMESGEFCHLYEETLMHLFKTLSVVPLQYLSITWFVNCCVAHCSHCPAILDVDRLAYIVKHGIPSLRCLSLKPAPRKVYTFQRTGTGDMMEFTCITHDDGVVSRDYYDFLWL